MLIQTWRARLEHGLIDPDFAAGLASLCQAEAEEFAHPERLEQAAEALMQAHHNCPERFEPLLLLGYEFWLLGDHERARIYLQAAGERQPEGGSSAELLAALEALPA